MSAHGRLHRQWRGAVVSWVSPSFSSTTISFTIYLKERGMAARNCEVYRHWAPVTTLVEKDKRNNLPRNSWVHCLVPHWGGSILPTCMWWCFVLGTLYLYHSTCPPLRLTIWWGAGAGYHSSMCGSALYYNLWNFPCAVAPMWWVAGR